MVLVGEQTGQLDKTLINLAEFFEEEAQSGVRNLSALFEPLIIVIIGIGIGFLVFAMMEVLKNLFVRDYCVVL